MRWANVSKVLRSRGGIAGALAVLAVGMGVAMHSPVLGSDGLRASMSEAAALYGGACPTWDDEGSGCGVNGCTGQGKRYLVDWWLHDAVCNLNTDNCQLQPGQSVPGACGTFNRLSGCSAAPVPAPVPK
jgi:hypothetical protein